MDARIDSYSRSYDKQTFAVSEEFRDKRRS